MNKKYLIEDISCAACTSRIEKVISKKEGIKRINTNIITKIVEIDFDENISEKEILKTLKNMGFPAKEVEKKDEEGSKTSLISLVILNIIIMIVSMGPMMGLKLPNIISPDISPITHTLIQFVILIPVVIIAKKFFTRGFLQLIKLSPNMDSLIAIGTSSAIIYSIYSFIMILKGDTHFVHELYIESAITIIALIRVGKYLEDRAKNKTRDSITKLMDLSPKKAIKIIDDKEVEVDVKEIKKGDLIVVKEAERVPVDSVIIKGNTVFDESMLTGESIPNEKKEKDKVYAGVINLQNEIILEALNDSDNSIIQKIINIVEHAQNKKAPIQKIADKVSLYFVPIVIVIAIISAVFWYIYKSDISLALRIFISVLVIACPCALGLATPTAIMVGTSKAANLGILIKGGDDLEKAHQVDIVVLDKTGTITEGKIFVTDYKKVREFDKELLDLYVSSVEEKSTHPISRALTNLTDKRMEVKEYENILGKGLKAKIDNKIIKIGNEKLIEEAKQYLLDGVQRVFVSVDNELIGYYEIEDKIKETSIEAIKKLKEQGLDIYMLTGDRYSVAKRFADMVGIDNIISDVLPTDKSDKILELKKENKVVMMVGDGINDSPALSVSDVSVAIGTGSDIAIDSSDIVLVNGDLNKVYKTIKLSREVIKNIKQNLFWAFFYNVMTIPVAFGLLYYFGGPLLNPMMAALAMSFSSITVVFNALRLRKVKI